MHQFGASREAEDEKGGSRGKKGRRLPFLPGAADLDKVGEFPADKRALASPCMILSLLTLYREKRIRQFCI